MNRQRWQASPLRFNAPPNWPPPPPGWTAPPGWQPDPSWGPPPPGWQLWVPEEPRNRTPLIVGIIMALVAVTAIVATVLVVATGSTTSDEEQIRAVLADIENAWNRDDIDAFNTNLCEQDLKAATGDFGFGVEHGFGRIEFTVESVDVDGDRATARVTTRFELEGNEYGPLTSEEAFAREDGRWKSCGSEAHE